MSRTQGLSLTLLAAGTLAIVGGLFVWVGLGPALVALGVLLIGADFLVPNR
jgi:hypothetical protein